MPAPFAKELCGYRKHGKPNTSDASERFSVELGHALFEAMGVPPDAPGDEPTGTPFSTRMADDLRGRVEDAEAGIVVVPERPFNAFAQYRHVGAIRNIRPEPSKDFIKAWNSIARFTRARIKSPPRDVARLEDLIGVVDRALQYETEERRLLLEEVGDESLLKLDVTAARENDTGVPHLEVGLSLKWSLRTDRAQDCRSQGAKMSALRRGRMPHFAAVTMEPRPYMLNLLGGGSGDVDCVYHLDLPSLTAAIDETCANRGRTRAKTRDTFRRLVDQRRVRDYDELADYVVSI